MLRAVHRWPGVLAALLLIVLSLSGAALSVFPVAERLSSPQAAASLSVADLTGRIQATYPGLEQIRQTPSGRITAYWFQAGAPQSAVINPATGQGVAPADPDPLLRWLTTLHRSLFLGDAGRLIMAGGAVAMLVLALSGMALVARRAGGWRHWFSPLRGPLAGRLHVEIARVAVVGLLLSSATALWMSAVTFDLLPQRASAPVMQVESGLTGKAVTDIELLQRTPVTELRSLSLANPGDATDVITLKTDRGTGYLDQGTGLLLGWREFGGGQRASDIIAMLHTGQGAALLGLILGLMALGVPLMAGTGSVLWLAGRRGRVRIAGNMPAARAETILLVGSESGSTWGFAATLHQALSAAGQTVHAAPMASFDPARYAQARRILILAATYGEGIAPASARGFLDRFARLDPTPQIPLAILGFGDHSFAGFCTFAKAVHEAATAKNWPELLPYDTVDRQSPQHFSRWGRALGITLDLAHVPALPATRALTLVSRRDYGAEVQAPTAILRFARPKQPLWQRLTGQGFARFRPGDLLGILPEGSEVPRFYSLASGSRDDFIEIVVRKQPGGLCSGQLTALEPGDSARAFLRLNPGFRTGRGRAPLILIGAGAGIGPLAGFVRANRQHRPVHLFFGLRDRDSDFLYGPELADWQRDRRLAQLIAATSRGDKPHHVQDALRLQAPEVARLIQGGARVMVCGGRKMAAGVCAALDSILEPVGLTPAMLKAEGRYVEDVY